MAQEEVVYLGLGSNLGDRVAHLRAGIDGLQRRGLRLHARSSFYLTEPDLRYPAGSDAAEAIDDIRENGEQPQHPWYVNCVAAFTGAPSPRQLLELCLAVERDEGRVRRECEAGSNGGPQPRTLDIDLLLLGTLVVDEPGLRVPHPRMHDRRFVLQPLAELDPGLIHPVTGESIGEMLAALPDRERVTPLEDQHREAG